MFTDIFWFHKWKHLCNLGSYFAFKHWINDVESRFAFTVKGKTITVNLHNTVHMTSILEILTEFGNNKLVLNIAREISEFP